MFGPIWFIRHTTRMLIPRRRRRHRPRYTPPLNTLGVLTLLGETLAVIAAVAAGCAFIGWWYALVLQHGWNPWYGILGVVVVVAAVIVGDNIWTATRPEDDQPDEPPAPPPPPEPPPPDLPQAHYSNRR